MNYYAVLIITISTIPIYNIFIAVIFCFDDSRIPISMNCYEGVYFIHFTVALIGLMVFLAIAIIISLFYIDTNLASKLPFASPSSKFNVFRLFLKLVITSYYLLF